MSNFEFTKIDLEGAYLIKYFSVSDKRGGFIKSFEKEIYKEAGINFSLSETFASVSEKNVIRGIHFQSINPQAKLVSILKGKAYDVIVDLRPESSTFKQWRGYEISDNNHLALYIPRGFAHGFAALEDNTIMLYQCDGVYDAKSDMGIIFNDPDIGVEWPVDERMAIHSQRDLGLMSFKEYMKNIMSFRRNKV